MCGLVGFYTPQEPIDHADQVIQQMTDRLQHRGPDADGMWIDQAAGITLGHRRLSILDTAPSANQPMHSHCQRWVITYNGEVYNFKALRQTIEQLGHSFRGHCDTEVIVEAFSAWGAEQALKKLNGMFAIAAWDRQQRQLILARDPIGIKPLYWAKFGQQILFASELKALTPHPAWQPDLDREAITAYMRFGYIPTPMTIWQQAHKLAPGQMLVVSEDAQPQLDRFWQLDNCIATSRSKPFDYNDQQAISALDTVLHQAIEQQMVADVPLGAFLSGGIDSSVVAAIMQDQRDIAIKTFAIGFNETGYNEAPHAAAVAKHLGTEHTELYVDDQQAQAIIPNLAEWYDEPFADSSQIPTYLLSKMTQQHVTVALSGDGGDECFAGYNRYLFAQKMLCYFRNVPKPIARMITPLLHKVPTGVYDQLGRLLPKSWQYPQLGNKIHKAAGLCHQPVEAIYFSLVSRWKHPEQLILDTAEPYSIIKDPHHLKKFSNNLDRLQYCDMLTYLPDDILTKVDRASMAVSLEVRVPLLDQQVIEFAWSLPEHMKQRNNQGKWLLRQVLHQYAPPAMVERPKMGFSVPIGQWLKGPLKEWAWSRLSPEALSATGILNRVPIQQAWQQHQSSTSNEQYRLWTALILQDWLMR